MAYELPATSSTPALIVFLIDLSISMNTHLGEKTRLQVVADALGGAIRQMVFRSTKGRVVSPRYRLALVGYSSSPVNFFDGVLTVDEVAQRGIPPLHTQRFTRTAEGFSKVREILEAELPNLQDCPAPLVCHMTDGQFTGPDPEPVVRAIQEMSVADGNVLVENVFMSDKVLTEPITEPYEWEGIMPTTPLASSYAEKLRSMSSTLPESYREMMQEEGYTIEQGAKMMLPGNSVELVAMAFQMASATKLR